MYGEMIYIKFMAMQFKVVRTQKINLGEFKICKDTKFVRKQSFLGYKTFFDGEYFVFFINTWKNS